MLSIAEKHEFNTFTSCGSCAGRQMIRHVRVTSDALVDDGLSSVHPELDVIDDLFQRIGKNQPTTGIASEETVHFLRPLLSAAYQKSHQVDPNWISVGMLDGYTFTSRDKSGSLCFQADELGPISFTLAPSRNGYFVAHAENAKTKECGGG